MTVSPTASTAHMRLLSALLIAQIGFVGAFTAPSLMLRQTPSVAKTDTSLFSTPNKRQPRRNLKKRRNRRDKDKYIIKADDFPWESAESRPIVASKSVEAGQDYWIDEDELKESMEREEALKNRKAMEGEIPKQKLREEIVAPYTQNWIGIISVGIVVLATIATQFPELLNSPIIQIPDL